MIVRVNAPVNMHNLDGIMAIVQVISREADVILSENSEGYTSVPWK